MSVQSLKRLNSLAAGQFRILSSLIAVPAAVLLLVAFFLHWMTVLERGTVLGQATGVQIATGFENATIAERAGIAFNTSAEWYLWIIPIAAVVTLLVAGVRLLTQRASGLVLGTYLGAGLLSLLAILLRYLRVQIDLTDARRSARLLINVEYNIGVWLGLLAGALLIVAAVLAYRSESRLSEHPIMQRLTRSARSYGLQFGIVGVLLLLELLFIIGSPETFLDTQIYRALMTSIPYWGIIALPLTMVVIAGEIDLSFPSTMAVGMVAFFEVYTRQASMGLALAGALVAGFLVGLLNGLIIVRLGIPSLIATIGTQFFWRGVVEVVRGGQGESMTFTKDSVLRNMLVSKVQDYFPAQVIWMLIVGVVVWIILNRHKFGAHVYLIGDNEDSARLMGVNVGLTRVMLFAIVGVAAAFAGLIQSVDNWYFWPNLGEGYLMQTLAAVFLGGTSVFGGTGTIFGTFVACFIIGMIQPGIVAVGLTGYYTKLIYGLIITASVAMHTVLRKRMA